MRLTLAIPSFIQTPLLGKSHPRQNNFIFPFLHVRTVSEEIVDSLYSGYGRTIYLPGIMRYLTSLVGPHVHRLMFSVEMILMLIVFGYCRGELPSGC